MLLALQLGQPSVPGTYSLPHNTVIRHLSPVTKTQRLVTWLGVSARTPILFKNVRLNSKDRSSL